MSSPRQRHRRSRFIVSEVQTTYQEYPGGARYPETGYVVWDKATGRTTSPFYLDRESAEIARRRLLSGASEEELHLP